MELQAALVEELHARLPEAGFDEVRPTHCQVLARIGPGGSRLTDLAAAARMTKQSMSALVDHLERHGYVERMPEPTDARVRIIRLTPAGRRALQVTAEAGARLEAEWAKRIGPRRVEQLREALALITNPLRGVP